MELKYPTLLRLVDYLRLLRLRVPQNAVNPNFFDLGCLDGCPQFSLPGALFRILPSPVCKAALTISHMNLSGRLLAVRIPAQSLLALEKIRKQRNCAVYQGTT